MLNQHNMSSISNKKKFIIKKTTTNRRTIKIKIKKNNINRLVDKTNQYMKNIGFKLHPHQEDGIKWMLTKEIKGVRTPYCKINGGLLCDDPGLGKTIQTCATMWANPVLKTLLIVPVSIINQWVDTIVKILPNYKVYVHHGNKRSKTLQELVDRRSNITITTIHNAGDSIIQQYKKWDRVIVDEVQYIKNGRSHSNNKLCSIRSKYKWGLSGTPIQNSEKDLFAIYKYIGVHSNELYIDNLQTLNSQLLLKRTKQIFKHSLLPKLVYNEYLIDFKNEEERAIYRDIKENIMDEYMNLMEQSTSRHRNLVIIELLLRLRQVSIHPQIALNAFKKKFNTTCKYEYSGIPTKMSSIVNKIKETGNDLCLVFCQFKDEIAIFDKILKENGIGCKKYDGSMSIKEKQQVIDSFLSNSEQEMFSLIQKHSVLPHEIDSLIGSFLPKVLLIQIKAGGVGLNLQQFKHIFITSPDWNPSNEIQAIARAHRLGQKHSVHVHKYILVDSTKKFITIDEYIYNTQIIKINKMIDIINHDSIIDISKIKLLEKDIIKTLIG